MEVDEVLGKRSEVTEEDLEKLQFTEQVIYTCSYWLYEVLSELYNIIIGSS